MLSLETVDEYVYSILRQIVISQVPYQQRPIDTINQVVVALHKVPSIDAQSIRNT